MWNFNRQRTDWRQIKSDENSTRWGTISINSLESFPLKVLGQYEPHIDEMILRPTKMTATTFWQRMQWIIYFAIFCLKLLLQFQHTLMKGVLLLYCPLPKFLSTFLPNINKFLVMLRQWNDFSSRESLDICAIISYRLQIR